MKHIKPYDETYFNIDLPKDVLSDLKDICLELSDSGFQIDIDKKGAADPCNPFDRPKYSNVWIYLTYKEARKRENRQEGEDYSFTFTYKEIEEVVERIKDYIQSKGYQIEIYLFKNGKVSNLENNKEKATLVKLSFNDIKSHNESKIEDENKDFLADIEEICYDLTDNGEFYQSIVSPNIIVIRKTKMATFELTEEIKEVLLRIMRYLGDRFKEMIVLNNYDDSCIFDQNFNLICNRVIGNPYKNWVLINIIFKP